MDDYRIAIQSDESTTEGVERTCADAAAIAELVDFVHPKKLGNPYRRPPNVAYSAPE